MAARRIETEVKSAGEKAGTAAGDAVGDGLVRGVDGRLRDARGRFVKAGSDIGNDVNKAIDQATRQAGLGLVSGLSVRGRTAGRNFGVSFGSQLAHSMPGVSGFTSAMSGYQGAAAKTGALAGRALGLAFTTAATGLIGAAGFALFKGFDRYKSLDATAHRLGAMGKSAQEVNEIMASINDVVEGTPIALDAAAASATKFLQSGVRQGRPMELALGAIADAAGASGSRFEDLSLIFNQVLNKGKLQAEEMMQFAERNLPIQAALQREFGLTGAELDKMSKEGTLSFGMLVQAVDGQFGGMAKKLGDTVDGALSNINAAVGRTGANFISAIFGDPLSTTEGPGAFAESLNNVKNRIEDINQWVIAHQDDIKRYFEQAVEAAGDVAEAVKTVIDALNDLNINIGDVAKAFAAWKLIKFTGVLSGLGQVSTQVSKIGMIKPAAGSVLALLAAFEAVDWRDRLNPEDSRNIQNRAERGDWGSVLLGDAWPWLREQLGLDRPPDGTSGGGGSFAEPGNGMPALPGFGMHWDPQRGWVADDGPAAPQDNGNIADLFPPAAGADGSSGSKGPTLPVVPYTGDPMSLLQGFQVTSSLYSAAESVLKAQHDRAQAESDLNALIASNEATAEEIQKARNKVAQADTDIFQAELRLNEAKQSATEKYAKTLEGLTADLGEIGAGLDKDFGISKGLAGIAENITKFVANLAAAPLLGQLGAISAVNPTQGGHGLMGILGAQGVFGPQYMNNQYAEQDSASAMGPTALRPGSNPNVNAMLNLAQAASGRTKYAPASDLVNGLADCSGSISDLVEMLQTGTTSSGRLFTTTNFASDAEAAKLGFRPGFMPGALNVGVNPYPGMSGHMAATLPNGVNFEGGGGTGGGAQYGGNAAGALDPQFEKQYYLPVGSTAGSYPAPGLYSPANTNPALTGVPSMPGGPLSTGVPQSAPFGPGPNFGPSFNQHGLIGPAAPGPQPGTVPYGGGPGLTGTGSGGVGYTSGGLIDMGIQAGALAADIFAPGAGQAAQTGAKLINRTIEYGSQVAGIAAQGWMDTLLPFGGSELASNNWLTRIVGGLAGAAPALPNLAGKAAGQLSKDQVAQQQQQGQPQQGQPPVQIHYEAHNQTEDRNGADLTWHMEHANAGPGM